MLYLYVKTHNKTGLKYLGYTSNKNPHLYEGSGIYWKTHLNKHGKDFTTEIIKECSTKEEIKEWGKHYSDLWNVVDSNEWANLKPEEGDGGNPGPEGIKKIVKKQIGRVPWNKGKKMPNSFGKQISERQIGSKQSQETIQKRAEKNRGQKRSEETKQRMSEAQKGRTFTKETKKKQSLAKKGKTWEEIFGKEGAEHRRKNTYQDGGKIWTIVDEYGKIEKIKSLRKWCDHNNISYKAAHQAARRNGKHKGYTFTSEEE